MRPLRLEMAAFGPYAHREVLDYTVLGDHGLFLLHGPTGGGKTTILDAMCYALYGESSGGERDAKGMRSHLAAPTIPTEVVFDFSVGVERYRVRRRPEQPRPKARGQGMTMETAEAELWRRTDCEGPDDEGELRSTGPRSVNAEIESILGFGPAQFRQVVVLPQGQFRRLLTARSDEREKILTTLFDTDRFTRLQDRLKAEAALAKKRAEDLRDRSSVYLQQAGVASPAELQERVTVLAAEAEEASQRVIAAREAQGKAAEAASSGHMVAAAFTERDQAVLCLNELIESQSEIEALRSEVAQAEAAEPVSLHESAFLQQRKSADDARASAEVGSGKLLNAQARRDAASTRLGEERMREPEREQARRRVDELTALATHVEAISRGREDLERARARQQETADAEGAAAIVFGEAREAVAALTQKCDQLRVLSLRLDGLESEHREVQRRFGNRTRLDQLLGRVTMLEEEHVASVQRRLAAAENLSTAQAAELSLREQWVRGQAARLAEHLTSGATCPVCGSLEHPSPAEADSQLPSDEELEAAGHLVATLGQQAQQAAVAEASAEATLQSAQEQVAAVEAELGVHAAIDLQILEAAVADLSSCVSDAANARAALPLTEHEIDEASVALRRAEADAQECAKKHAEAAAAVGAALAVLADRELLVPHDYRDPAALALAHAQAEHHLVDVTRTFDEAVEEDRAAALEFAVCETSATRLAEAAHTAAEGVWLAEQRFRDAIASAGFMDEPTWRTARRGSERREAITAQIEKYTGERAAAEDRSRRAEEAVTGKERPDLAGLDETLQIRAEELEAAVGHEVSTEQSLAQLRQLCTELGRLATEVTAAEAWYTEIGHVAEVAAGQNNHKLPFQRYVLGSLLDEVLTQATARLHLMSRGRYELLRAAGPQGRSRTGGLDLEVMDHHTGVPRPTVSLSGGESFLAALSLALGLADVVQTHQGGRYLETIFIDEGFGTLDPESLDLAMRALVDLQSAGRLVGVISHVPELKQLIPARLEVISTPGGSHTRFTTN